MIDQNPIDVYAAKQGTGSKVIGSFDSLDSIEKEIQETDNRIFELNGLIKSKTAEIEAIKSGTNLSDLERAAREEYARTGSSSAMQGIENSKISREMTAKTQAEIDEEKKNDAEADAEVYKTTIGQLYGKYLDQGNSLSNEDKEKAVSALASLKKLSSKRKGIDDDFNGDGIEDTVENRAQELKEATTTTTTKELPKDNADLGIKLSQLKNIEEKDALTKLYIDNHLWFKNGVLDTSKIPDTETYAKEYAKRTGATGTGATKTTDSKKNAAAAEKAFKNSVLEKLKTMTTFRNLYKSGDLTDKAWNTTIGKLSDDYAGTKNAGKIDKALIESLLKELK